MSSPHRGGRRPRLALTGLLIVLAGCSAGGASGGAGAADLHRATFDPAAFVDPTTSTNRWHPLHPGMQWVREGTTDVGSRDVPHQVISTMTDVIREIDGVPTIAMLDQDTDAGELAEESIDYFGLDEDGNVWLLGGYTEAYSGGEYTNAGDAWLGSGQGARPGILVPPDPTTSTPPWLVGLDPDGNGTSGEVDESGRHTCVDFACYDDVLVIREDEIGGGKSEFKSYAPDVGQILNAPRRNASHHDVESLVNLTRLSPQGLDEMSAEVLRLEAHARQTEPDVFGAAPDSTRAR